MRSCASGHGPRTKWGESDGTNRLILAKSRSFSVRRTPASRHDSASSRSLAKASDTRARSRPSPRINADRKSYRNRNTATVLDSIFSAGFQACLTNVLPCGLRSSLGVTRANDVTTPTSATTTHSHASELEVAVVEEGRLSEHAISAHRHSAVSGRRCGGLCAGTIGIAGRRLGPRRTTAQCAAQSWTPAVGSRESLAISSTQRDDVSADRQREGLRILANFAQVAD
jgi:hypothetical protein